jgi:hypothetical protein
MSPPVGEDFEPWLEQELRQALGPVRGPSPRADQAGYRRAAARGRGPLALVGAKGAAIIAVAAFAVGLGATGATAMTGSVNPVSWGKRVVQAVSSCRDRAGADVPDVGRCVSAFAGPTDPTPARSAAPPSPGARAPVPSPSPTQSGILKQSLEKDENGDQSDQTAQGANGGQNGQSGQDKQNAHSSAAGKPPHPTAPPKRPSPKPRPTPGGG